MKPIIHPTAIIGPNVTIEDDVFIGPYCVIGTHAEYRSKVNERTDEPGRVFIGRGTTIREFVTVHGSAYGKTTHIGPGCYIQAHAHIGHDAYLDGLQHHCVSRHRCRPCHNVDAQRSWIGGVTHQGARIEHGAFIGASAFFKGDPPSSKSTQASQPSLSDQTFD
jgi:UDP-N-acetylglucosamine acyltransferase